ncbi:MAG: peptidylprolyl isomerase [Chlorobiota bacterium]|nr:MAG: peptidylprolyl isomerase [Chlorobiota bacterium]
MNKFYLVVIIFCFSVINIHSQVVSGSKRQLIDGVAAVVGNEVILKSNIIQQIYILIQQKQGNNLDVNDPKVFQQILNSVIDEKLVLAQAKEDSITVNDDEVQQALDMRLSGLIQQVGSEERLEKIYGMTMVQIRNEARELIKSQMLVENIQRRKFSNVKPTENDINEFYSSYKDSLPYVPEQFEIKHLALKIKPSQNAKELTIALANKIIDSLKNGGDFSDFAKRYSSDPGSAVKGGDLGFVGEGKFVKPFEDAAKQLSIMEISKPIETQFGFHIIQLLDKKNNEHHTRHILLKVIESDVDKTNLINRLNELKNKANSGESFDSLAKKFSEDESSRGSGGNLGKFSSEQLTPDYKRDLSNLKVGEISNPSIVSLSPTENAYHILKFSQKIPAHKLDPKEDRIQLARMATVYKQNKEYSKWLVELRSKIYWEIK